MFFNLTRQKGNASIIFRSMVVLTTLLATPHYILVPCTMKCALEFSLLNSKLMIVLVTSFSRWIFYNREIRTIMHLNQIDPLDTKDFPMEVQFVTSFSYTVQKRPLEYTRTWRPCPLTAKLAAITENRKQEKMLSFRRGRKNPMGETHAVGKGLKNPIHMQGSGRVSNSGPQRWNCRDSMTLIV